MARKLIEVHNLKKTFRITEGVILRRTRGITRAVDDVSLDIHEGETVGCVGGSGSGKSTLGRLILQLVRPDSGEVVFDGTPLTGLSHRGMRPYRRAMQIVFQDPLHSLNPRRTAMENVERPLINFGVARAEARERVSELMRLVGLDPDHAQRYPHEFSGGQCQRIAIARALALEPRFLFLDEPVSALDVSIQAQILNLLKDLQRQLNLTYLFVSHDLKIVKQFADRTVVMYRGRIMEVGDSNELYRNPRHPFTRDFLGTVLHMHRDSGWEQAAARAEDIEEANQRQAADETRGCVYADTCSERFEPCRTVRPDLYEAGPARLAACHLFGEAANERSAGDPRCMAV